MNKKVHIKPSVLKIICLIIFALLVIFQAWIADDSFHIFVMAKNFINGHGLVYNIGVRTNASTTPLLLLLTTFLSYLTGEIEFTAIAIGVVTSVAAFGLLIRRIESNVLIVLATLCVSLSYGFMAFTTSGIETSLIFLIQIIFIDYILNHQGNYTFKQLFYVALLCSLSLLTRFDTCFLMFFPTAYIFLRKKDCSFPKMFLAGILGLLPFFAWIGFSIIYYGFPFPNTFYAKIRSNVSLMDYFRKGIDFYIVNFLCDTITLLIIIAALILLTWKGDALRRMIAVGMFLKLVYILRIGGDFMLGRHFAGLFIVAVYIIIDHSYKNKLFEKISIVKAGFICSIFVLLFVSGSVFKPCVLPYSDVADERGYYYSYLSLQKIIESKITGENYPLRQRFYLIPEVEKDIEAGYQGDVISFAPGILVFNYVDKINLYDQCALADPLLPYMSVDWNRSKAFASSDGKWRIGHLQRKIPDGYRESLQQNTNVIKDPEIHELYDKILLVVRSEDLFAPERLKAIWELNTKYRHFNAD